MTTRKLSTNKKKGRRLTARERKAQRARVKGYVVVFLLAVIVSSFVYVIHQPNVRVAEVQVSANTELQQRSIETIIAKHSSGHAWLVFPRNVWLWYPKQAITTEIYALHPEIRDLQIDIENRRQLSLTLVERERDVLVRQAEQMYELDTSGLVFREVALSPEDFYIQVPDSYELVLSERLMDEESYRELTDFVRDLERAGFQLDNIIISNEIEYIVTLVSGERLIINPHDGYERIVATLEEIAPYKEFGFNSMEGNFSKPLEYINLRYGNKLFYCYTGDECSRNYITE